MRACSLPGMMFAEQRVGRNAATMMVKLQPAVRRKASMVSGSNTMPITKASVLR